MSSTVFKIERGEFGLSLTDPGVPVADAVLSAYTDYSCSVLSGAVTADQQTETDDIPATFCDAASSTLIPQTSEFTLTVSILQDPQLVAGISQFCFDNDATRCWFYLGLAEGSAPKAIGTFYISAIDFGGDAKVVLTADAEWPIDGKPEIEFGTTPDA